MKDYKKILEGVVNIINTTEKSDIGFANICTYIGENCPELQESEDERIRQVLIDYFNNANKSDENPLYEYGIYTDKVIIWLEKQGKNPNKIKSLFKAGDCITNGERTWFISDVCFNMYTLLPLDSNIKVEDTISYVDKHFHLWTIQDAKPGDVLATDHHILILKELDYDWYSNGTPYSVKAYCGIKPNGNFELGKENWCFCGTLHIHPATKEQHDTLFTKMKESGYEWDTEKKELKKIEKQGDVTQLPS